METVSRIVFLLEEPSMKVLLEALLPRAFPDLEFLCVPHEGKQDLEKSIPRKLRAWNEPGVRFVVIRDNDRDECKKVKNHLRKVCEQAGRPDTVVRIACQELEAWYLGAPETLDIAYCRNDMVKLSRQARFRDPDTVERPSSELAQRIPEFQKMSAARLMGKVLPVLETGSRSRSYQVFLSAVRNLTATFKQQREE